jgi:hypothetical protein
MMMLLQTVSRDRMASASGALEGVLRHTNVLLAHCAGMIHVAASCPTMMLFYAWDGGGQYQSLWQHKPR